LEWKEFTDIEKWNVLLTKVISPLHCFAVQICGADGRGAGCFYKRLAPTKKPILDWQHERAYDGIPGKTLKLLVEHYGGICKELEHAGCGLEENVGEGGVDDGTVMGLMLHNNPHMDPVTMSETLANRHRVSKEEWKVVRESMDDQVLLNLMVRQDYLETVSWVASSEQKQDHTREQLKKLNVRAQTYCSRATPVLGRRRSAAKAKPKARDPTVAPVPRGSGPEATRWKAALKARDPELLQQLKPARSSVWKDQHNGNYRLLYDAEQVLPGYVSWTVAGHGSAQRQILTMAWAEEAKHGGAMPDDVRDAIASIPD